MRLPGGRGPRLGLGGILLLLVLSYVFGTDLLSPLLGGTQVSLPSDTRLPDVAVSSSPQEERQVEFVSFVLDDLQDTWTKVLPGYRDAKLVLFRGAVRSGCGAAQSAMGPFYCPADQKVYIDLGFYDELKRRFGAPGDFAQAYVLAHEIGHHVQHLTGLDQRVRTLQRQNPREANAASVRLELQADCLAGVWGHSTARRDILESGDIEEGLGAAAAIGDDRIQRQTTGSVRPEAFTHGSSAQRVEWLRRGYESGDPDACNTFND